MNVFALADTRTSTQLDARIDGPPVNLAIELAQLAQPVSFLGAVSSEFLGQHLMRAIINEGVDTHAVARTDARTTLSLVGRDAAGVASYAFNGEAIADRQLGAAALQRVSAGMRALHVGSYTSVVEHIASTLRALVERERRRALVSYDPNIRLHVEPDLAGSAQWPGPQTHRQSPAQSCCR